MPGRSPFFFFFFFFDNLPGAAFHQLNSIVSHYYSSADSNLTTCQVGGEGTLSVHNSLLCTPYTSSLDLVHTASAVLLGERLNRDITPERRQDRKSTEGLTPFQRFSALFHQFFRYTEPQAGLLINESATCGAHPLSFVRIRNFPVPLLTCASSNAQRAHG